MNSQKVNHIEIIEFRCERDPADNYLISVLACVFFFFN